MYVYIYSLYNTYFSCSKSPQERSSPAAAWTSPLMPPSWRPSARRGWTSRMPRWLRGGWLVPEARWASLSHVNPIIFHHLSPHDETSNCWFRWAVCKIPHSMGSWLVYNPRYGYPLKQLWFYEKMGNRIRMFGNISWHLGIFYGIYLGKLAKTMEITMLLRWITDKFSFSIDMLVY